MRPSLACASACVLAACCVHSAHAQCATRWLPGHPLPGTDTQVFAQTLADPDGSGPLGLQVVLCGEFRTAGDQSVNRIATYDPATGNWSSLGSGTNGSVYALATLPNGDVVAGGAFSTADGIAASGVARWNGTAWQPLGAGTSYSGFGTGAVMALAVRPNGELIAGGVFDTIGGVPASNIAAWNGSTWSALGTGIVGQEVSALAVLANGDVIAGGHFDTAGGIQVPNLARWDGFSWSDLGAPPLGFTHVNTIAQLTNGDVLVGGRKGTVVGGTNPVPSLVRYDGAAWTVLHSAAGNQGIHSILVEPAGAAVVGGVFALVGGTNSPCIVRMTSSGWSGLGRGIDWMVRSLCRLPNGDIVAAGAFETAGGRGVANMARWDGATWQPLAAGTTRLIAALLQRPDGTVVAGGSFGAIAGIDAVSVASWSGAAWSPFGPDPERLRVQSLAHLTNGNLVVGGANGVRRWNGTTWSWVGDGGPYPFGSGVSGTVRALAALPNGGMLAGGAMLLAPATGYAGLLRWDGAAWQPMPGLAGSWASWFYQVLALCKLDDGRIVAGGQFATAAGATAGGVALWDGATWSTLAGGTDGTVCAIAEMPNGDLVVGGVFTTAGGVPATNIARWNGSAWSALGAGLDDVVNAVVALPNSDVVVTGDFLNAGAVPVRRIARWDGAAWTPFGTGLDWQGLALALDANDRLLVGGMFQFADGAASAYLATIAPTCPATRTALGAGCPSSGGGNTLTADLPWLGATWEARGTGLPSQALVLSVLGLGTTSLALPALLPQGAAGCTLHVTPDRIDLAAGAAGTAHVQLALPSSPALIAAVFHAQFVPLELGAAMAITSATVTNALTLTIGTY